MTRAWGQVRRTGGEWSQMWRVARDPGFAVFPAPQLPGCESSKSSEKAKRRWPLQLCLTHARG